MTASMGNITLKKSGEADDDFGEKITDRTAAEVGAAGRAEIEQDKSAGHSFIRCFILGCIWAGADPAGADNHRRCGILVFHSYCCRGACAADCTDLILQTDYLCVSPGRRSLCSLQRKSGQISRTDSRGLAAG
ncbi:hypothetical protein D3C80_1634550 [compost metagenome]